MGEDAASLQVNDAAASRTLFFTMLFFIIVLARVINYQIVSH